jgi:hypothetical protein
MTKVNGIAPGTPTSATVARGPDRPVSGAFSLRSGTAPAATGGLTAVTGVALPGMLALQEAEAEASRDREARRHGQAVLEELAGLQRALLAGPADPALLNRLTALTKAPPEAADPLLRAALQAVALRAKVELARLSLAGG